ncbi:MAG: dipeptidase, partial [Chitinophagaceae bacterium]
THTDLARLFAGGVDVQVFSIFCDGKQVQPYNWARREIDSVEAWARRNPKQLTILHSSKELFRTVKAGKIGAFMGVEGGHMIENHLEYLDTFFARGVRYMTLTWNNSTDWATSALDETTEPNLPHKGLTDFGKSVIRKMNQLGMLVDISHVGEQTFWDALSVTTKPVIASHSSVYALCPHRRNLKDDQIRAIGKNGGVIHLNFFAGFLDSTYQDKSTRFTALHQAEVDSLIAQGAQADYARMMIAEKYPEELKNVRPPLELLLTHLDYVVRLVGVDHVGLGSDFDGIEAAPRELNGVEDFPLLTQALLKRGYTPNDIHKILGGNFIRVLQANEKSTGQLSTH